MIGTHMKKIQVELDLVDTLETETPGVYFFPVDDTLDATITDLNPGVLLECEICEMPKQNLEMFYTQLLLANLFGQGTYGAKLGISADGNKLLLQQYLDYTPNFQEFDELLEDFLNAAEFWRDEALAAA